MHYPGYLSLGSNFSPILEDDKVVDVRTLSIFVIVVNFSHTASLLLVSRRVWEGLFS